MALRLELPLPPRELSPNASGNWKKRYRITNEVQQDTMARVFEQQARGKPLDRATVTVTFVVPDLRRLDKDNLVACSKPFLDGLVLAGVLSDDNWRSIETVYEVECRKGESKTIIKVEQK